MTLDLYRLEYQVSSLEREISLSQQNAVRAETQLAEVQGKYEATPKQEVIDRYVKILCSAYKYNLHVHLFSGWGGY